MLICNGRSMKDIPEMMNYLNNNLLQTQAVQQTHYHSHISSSTSSMSDTNDNEAMEDVLASHPLHIMAPTGLGYHCMDNSKRKRSSDNESFATHFPFKRFRS